MKKNTILFIVAFLIVHRLQGQTPNCKITGRVINDGIYKYAMLYLPDNKSKYITEVTNSCFGFDIEKPVKLRLGIIFLGKDSLKSYADVVEHRKFGVNESRSIVIEDLEMIIDNDMSRAIVNGGVLNKDNDRMHQAINTRKYDDFFAENPDSPLALELLKALIGMNSKKLPFGGSSNLNTKSYYNKLSERLKNSEKGKDLKAKINNQ